MTLTIEQVRDSNRVHEGVMAVCGFGGRGSRVDEVEFDPLGAVWPPGTMDKPVA